MKSDYMYFFSEHYAGFCCLSFCRMHILNLNKQIRLYQQGFTPLIRTVPGRGGWERMRDRPEWQVTNEWIDELICG